MTAGDLYAAREIISCQAGRRDFITPLGGAVAWPLAARMYEGRLIRNMAVQVLATAILFQSYFNRGLL